MATLLLGNPMRLDPQPLGVEHLGSWRACAGNREPVFRVVLISTQKCFAKFRKVEILFPWDPLKSKSVLPNKSVGLSMHKKGKSS
jgi:hypothetical protein